MSAVDINALAATAARNAIAPDQYLPIVTAPPFIPSRALFNIRDIGQVSGSGVPAGLAYRCGALDHVAKDPDAVAWMTSHVKKVFDLRKAGAERETAPDPELEGVENIWLPPSGVYPTPKLEDFVVNNGIDAWKVQYMVVARMYAPTFKAVLDHIRDQPTVPFLFHCTGKYCSLPDCNFDNSATPADSPFTSRSRQNRRPCWTSSPSRGIVPRRRKAGLYAVPNWH